MNLINRTLVLLTLFAVAGFAGTVSAQDADRFKDVQIKTVDVTDGVYMLIGAGGNIGVSVGEDGVFLIDDQFAPLTDKIKAAVTKLSKHPIRFLVNTHWHGDHVGGNENLGKGGTVIVAHDNVRKRMSVDNFSKAFQQKIPASPKIALPVITFNDTTTFHLNGEEIHVFHVANAHTDGDSVIHFKKSNVIHAGDLFFNGLYPFIDAESNGSVDGVINAARKIYELADDNTKIMPGHGPLSTKKDVPPYIDMLIATRDNVQKLIKQGKTLDEIKALKPNAAYDEKWGKGFLSPDKYINVLYAALTSK